MCIGIFSGCTKNNISDTSSSGEDSSKIEVVEPIPNNLTGLPLINPGAEGKRPVAVMINNIKDALPQYGIEAADIIYEVPVEGGITRLMAVYSDFTSVPKVCSVRSCRYYFPLLALGMDAIYVHWGVDKTIALDTLKRTGIDRFDGGTIGGEIFGRDAQRAKTYSSEHTGYLDGSKLPAAISKYKYRQDLTKETNKPIFNFSEVVSTPVGTPCTNAVINFSSAYFSTFTYDTTKATYKKQHSGKPHIDSSTKNQLEFTNVIVLQTTIKQRPSSYLMDVALTGGKGKYISNGVCEDILWSKASENSPIVLTKADGTKLEVNKGKSYIGFIGSERPIKIS